MYIIKRALLLILGLSLMTSCYREDLKFVVFQGEAQGTYYIIKYFDEKERNYQQEVDSLLNDFDMSLSLWKPNSVLSRVNRNDSTVELDENFLRVYEDSKEVYKTTEGAFDPTVGPLVNAWGFGFTDRLKVSKALIDSLSPLIGFDKVSIVDGKLWKKDPRIQMDFNAIAQGYSVDLVAELLESKGIKNFLIDIGGEVKGQGTKDNFQPWIVGIQKPTKTVYSPVEAQAKIRLTNNSFVTSGSYRKYYEEDGVRYSHTIDPVTGYPVTHTLLSVTVLYENCGLADAYATAFMVMGLERSLAFLEKDKRLNAFFIYSDENGELESIMTRGLEGVLED